MERRDCQVVVYFVVALAASLGLGLAIAYLEVKRSQEIVAIEVKWLQELDKMQKEIDSLREELRNRTNTLTETVNNLQQSQPALDDEDYYYDEYEDEEGEDDEEKTAPHSGGKGKEGSSGGKRSRREVRINPILAPYNLILRHYKTQPNTSGTPEVKARIIVASDQQQAYELEQESYGKPQGNGAAVHFTGDTTKVRHLGRHHGSRCYDVNHRMCHVKGIFKDWLATAWNNIVDNTFTMRDGELTLNRSPGIYYLYAQIFYADNHDVNGYRIYVNGSPMFQCTITNLHDERWIPHRVPHIKNSCYTGGLVQLNEGDRVTIREIDNVERYSVFEPYKSYFGLFKVVSLPSSRSKR